MAFIPTEGTIEVATRGTFNGGNWANIFHFDSDVAINPTQLGVAIGMMTDWWNGEIAPLISEDVWLTEIEARDVSIENSYVVVQPISPVDTGTLTEEALPNNVAACMTLRTPFAGRSARGRKYFTGLTVAEVALNIIDPGVVAGFIDAGQALIDVAPGFNMAWIIRSLYTNNAPREAGVKFEITSVTMDDRVDTMRRRLNSVAS